MNTPSTGEIRPKFVLLSIAGSLAREQFPLAAHDDTPVTLPFFKLLALLQRAAEAGYALATASETAGPLPTDPERSPAPTFAAEVPSRSNPPRRPPPPPVEAAPEFIRIQPEDLPPLVYAVEALGHYSTPEAALLAEGSLSEAAIQELLPPERNRRYDLDRIDSVLLLRSFDPDAFFGAYALNKLWVAIRGRKSQGFETVDQAKTFSSGRGAWHRELGKPAPAWLILERIDSILLPFDLLSGGRHE